MSFFNKLNILWICWLSLVLAACMDIRMVDKKAKAEVNAGDVQQMGPVSKNQVFVRPLESFGRYQVVFQGLSDRVFSLSRLHGEKKENLNLAVQNGQAFDEGVEAGQSYEYKWTPSSGAADVVVKVQIPLDFSLDKKMTLTDKENPFQKNVLFGRVFFQDGATLQTNGQNIFIRAQSIIFENAVIETFSSDAVAQVGQRARSGGALELNAPDISGTATFFLQGENGAPGANGDAAQADMSGSVGRRGENAEHEQTPANELGGPVGYICMKQATNGEKGGKGQRGKNGQSGGRGGDSGTLKVETIHDGQLFLTIYKTPGKGGQGGSGGAGGVGGSGGAAGETYIGHHPRNRFSQCREALPGQTGDPGDPGSDGYPGHDGLLQSACLFRAGIQIRCWN